MTPAELAALHALCFTTPRPWSEAEFSDLLDSRFVFLIPDPAGFLLARVIADEAELLTLAVAPDQRRAGIGARLVARFLDTAAARGATTAFLEVSVENTVARALYTRSGFVESGRRRGYYAATDRPPVDAIVMTRRLDATSTQAVPPVF